ncbi:hypothetical protein EV191_10744 [Tamaricihabitans halophyticus]|uniref:DUF6545 domain-containing protein n=1 Tax=Tamaricihabitans halophyticus TaxID=1262583 RepID=A0A4R2QPB6_9PSEU|nr:MAB_1171c family putative transporter [Tamaricihabitans halophyticus]TCP50784.1 hypothetical protein EV191_10744 [Tamaricihabitans halophyticus]
MNAEWLLSLAQGVLLGAALLWKLYQLSRAPYDVPLRIVTACLACAAAAYPVGLLNSSLRASGSASLWLELLHYALLCAVIYAIACFFIFAALGPERAARRARSAAVPLIVAVVLMTVLTAATPEGTGTRDYATSTVSLFYLVADSYLCFGLVMGLVWARRCARGAGGWLAHGLLLTSIGCAALIVGCGLLMTSVVVNWTGGELPAIYYAVVSLLMLPAILLFIVGVSYPGLRMRLAAARIWLQHLVGYHQLRPLWIELHRYFPEDALGRVPTSPLRDLLSLRGVHRRYYRRVIECRDGLVRISPYLGVIQERTETTRGLAGQLREALHAYAAGSNAPDQAVAIAVPDTDDLESDVRALRALSAELRVEQAATAVRLG